MIVFKIVKEFIKFYIIPGILSVFSPFYYFFMRKKMNKTTLYILFIINIWLYTLLTICCIVSKGYFSNPIWNLLSFSLFPYFLITFLSAFTGAMLQGMLFCICMTSIGLIVSCIYVKHVIKPKKKIIIFLCIFASLGVDGYLLSTSVNFKYQDHGFDYMNGYSSVDLSDYSPYAKNSRLVTLPKQSTFIIENEKDMPILDGAEACYPLYSAFAKATYQDIDQIELKYQKNSYYSSVNGKIVSFTNSSVGYSRLFDREIDMFFGAKPSKNQLEEAENMGVELEYTPIGKEAFVFFVSKDNPIDNLTSDQIKDIYHGSIRSWKEVGGDNKKIVAFQRPENSGSQVMMKYFMQDIDLKEPLTYEVQLGMGMIIEEVANYHNEEGAIGYSFKYFVEQLYGNDQIKLLAVDGIYPSNQSILDDRYPITTNLYLVTLKDNKKENVKKMRDFILSKQGQYIVEKTGYCPVK